MHEINHSQYGNHGLIISSKFTKAPIIGAHAFYQVTFLSHLSGTSRMTSSSPHKEIMPLSRRSQILDKNIRLAPLCRSISQSPTIHENTPIISLEREDSSESISNELFIAPAVWYGHSQIDCGVGDTFLHVDDTQHNDEWCSENKKENVPVRLERTRPKSRD